MRSQHKIELIHNLRELERINVELKLETNKTKKSHLITKQKNTINTIKKLTNHLNKMGKLNDKELIGLMKLDLYNAKRFNLAFTLGNLKIGSENGFVECDGNG